MVNIVQEVFYHIHIFYVSALIDKGVLTGEKLALELARLLLRVAYSLLLLR